MFNVTILLQIRKNPFAKADALPVLKQMELKQMELTVSNLLLSGPSF